MSVKNTQAKRLGPAKREKALAGLTALTQLKDYSPQRKDYDAAKAAAIATAQKAAADDLIAAQNALEKARDAANAADWNVYNFMQIAEEQVAGQYGSDSDEYASIGYKKKSEYKKGRPVGSKKGAAAKGKKGEAEV